jgi:NADP-dependent 3-hydroxy acid dehydrogenase YdfG
MAGSLQGKIAWVTGAGSGIGEAGALALAEAGATLVLSGRRAEQLEQVGAQIRAAGGTAHAVPLDVANSAAVAAAGADIIGRLGPVDILVNSAGTNSPKRFWKDLTPEGWREVFDINVHGSLYCINAVLPRMRERKDGIVINISSWAGHYVSYMTGPAYTASKHAVVAMTESLNNEECVNGIRACAVCPAEVSTPIMLKRPVMPTQEVLDRMLQPADLGRTIRFVAEMPPHACVNEILISPTWNRFFLGGADVARG